MSEIFKAFQANKAVIRAILWRYVRQAEVVEDLTQEVFLRAFSVEMEDDIREPRAYLLRTARNLGVNEVRKHANLFTESVEDSGGSEVFQDERYVSGEDKLDSKRKFALFCEAVAALPAECREPFLLRKVENLKFKQIATRLNLTVSTTEKRVARGLVLCKAYLRKHGHSPADIAVPRRAARSGDGTMAPRKASDIKANDIKASDINASDGGIEHD